MAEKNYSSKNTLTYLLTLLKGKMDNKVDKQHKTGSEDEYKVLSDNNLTDELLNKINDAGSSSFTGAYNDLTGIPTLDGTELKGTLTKEGLDIASKSDIPTDNADLANGAEYQTASDVAKAIETATADFVTDEDVDGKITTATTDMAKKSEVTKQIETATSDMATKTQVAKDISTATSDMATQTWVNSQIANINKKAVVTGTEQMTNENTIYLMANEGAGNNIYDEYIVYDGKPEKIGTTEVNLTGYIKEADLVEITNEEIDAMMSDW